MDRAGRHLVESLLENPRTLPHFFHAHQIAVETVADRADWHIEVVLVVAQIRVGLAQVMIHARAAQVRTGQTVSDGVLPLDDPDILGAIQPDRIAGEKFVHFIEAGQQIVDESAHLLIETGRQVARHSADARVRRGETGAGQLLGQIVNHLAVFEGVEKDGHGPDVHGISPDTEKVRRNARQLTADHADGLAARRQFPAHQFFHRQCVGHVVGQRREVIQPVRVRHELVVLHVLRDLLVAAVEVADVRIGLGNDLTVQLEHNAQHAVRRRVRGPHVDGQGLPEQFAFLACLGFDRTGARGGIGSLENSGHGADCYVREALLATSGRCGRPFRRLLWSPRSHAAHVAAANSSSTRSRS